MLGRQIAVLAAAGVTGAALAVVPALGADATVNATSGNTFTPATVTVAPGEKVTWKNTGGTHNVQFDGEADPASGPPAGPGWSYERAFAAEGSFRYYCNVHGGAGGEGMAGVVVVKTPPDTTPPKPAPAIEDFAAVPLRASFCTGGANCQRPGIVLRLQLPRDARVHGVVSRRDAKKRYRRFGTVTFDLKAGRRSVRFTETNEGRRIRAGRYLIGLTAAGERDLVRFKVRK